MPRAAVLTCLLATLLCAAAAAARGPVVAVVPLEGQVGGLVNRQVAGTFDADMLEACLQEAHRDGADLVLLEVNSPGGLVAEMELVCEKIIAWRDRLRIAAFTRDAFSAAAIIALSCPELVVHPESRVGAAVMVHRDAEGLSAVDAKSASVHHARQRQLMEASGRPYEVVAAMTIQETALWWSPAEGFTTTAPAGAAGWSQVDGQTTVLTMTAGQALEWGLARASARSPRDAAAALGLAGDDVHLRRLDDVARRYNADLDRKLEGLNGSFRAYFEGLDGIAAGMNGVIEAARAGDRRAAGLMKSQVSRGRSKALRAARRIRDTQRTILSRRIVVADRIVERLEADAELLGSLGGLLATDQVDDFNQAAQSVNQVLAEWRELFSRP